MRGLGDTPKKKKKKTVGKVNRSRGGPLGKGRHNNRIYSLLEEAGAAIARGQERRSQQRPKETSQGLQRPGPLRDSCSSRVQG